MAEFDSDSSFDASILPAVSELAREIIANRRWFHSHPELAYEEHETAAKIANLLRSYGITEVYEAVGRTGVVAMIRGGKSGPCIALRADMDALPVLETAEIDYKSMNDGVMHACGHDGHMACLLAAAKILNSDREQLSGSVKLIFQPAEEGKAGAAEMIADGVLDDGRAGSRVDSIYGMHLWSYRPVGEIGCQEGAVMAACDSFQIDVKGIGGHGAAPQGTVDAIVSACTLVQNMQTIVSRNMDPLESGVITCGTISGGYGYNIIADHVRIEGTCRSFSSTVRQDIKQRMQAMCCGVAHTFGGDICLDIQQRFPPTVNSYPECNAAVVAAASKIVGAACASEPQRTMVAEDFAFFLQQRPGCFFFVGAALPGALGAAARPHHQPLFDFDERALLIGASVFVQLIRDLLLSSSSTVA